MIKISGNIGECMLKVDIAIIVIHPILPTRDIMPIFDIKATAWRITKNADGLCFSKEVS